MTKRVLSLVLTFIMAFGVLTIVGTPVVSAATAAGSYEVAAASVYTYSRYAEDTTNTIANVIDGSTSTYWHAGYHKQGDKVQFIIDRGNTNPFNRIEITFKTYNTMNLSVYGADRIADTSGTLNKTTGYQAAGTLPSSSGVMADNLALDNISYGNDAYQLYENTKINRNVATHSSGGTFTIEFNVSKKRYIMIENEIGIDIDDSAECQLAISEVKFYYDVVDVSSFYNMPTHKNADTNTLGWTNYQWGSYIKNFDDDWYIYPYVKGSDGARITDPHFIEFSISGITDGDSYTAEFDASNFADPVIDRETGKIKISAGWFGTFTLTCTNKITGKSIGHWMRISEGNYGEDLSQGKKTWVPNASGWGSTSAYTVDGLWGTTSVYTKTTDTDGAFTQWTRSKILNLGKHSGAQGPIIVMNPAGSTAKPYNYVHFRHGLAYSLDGYRFGWADSLENKTTGAAVTTEPTDNTAADVTISSANQDKQMYSYTAEYGSLITTETVTDENGKAVAPQGPSHYMPINTSTARYFYPKVDIYNADYENHLAEVNVSYLPPSRIRIGTPYDSERQITNNETGVTTTYGGTGDNKNRHFYSSGYYADGGESVRNSDHVVTTNPIISYSSESYGKDGRFTYDSNGYYTRVTVPIESIYGGYKEISKPFHSRPLVTEGRTQADNTMLDQLNWYLGEVEGTTELNGVQLVEKSDGAVELVFTEDTVPHLLKLTCYWEEYGMVRVQDTLEIPVLYQGVNSSSYENVDGTDINGRALDHIYSFQGFGGLSFKNAMNGINSDHYMTSDRGSTSNTWTWGDHSRCFGGVYFRRDSGFSINKAKVNPARYNTDKITIHGVPDTYSGNTAPDFTDDSIWRDYNDLATSSDGGELYCQVRASGTAGYYAYVDGAKKWFNPPAAGTAIPNTADVEDGRSSMVFKAGDYVDIEGNYVPRSSSKKVRYFDTGTSPNPVPGFNGQQQLADDGRKTEEFTYGLKYAGTEMTKNSLGEYEFYGNPITKASTHPDYSNGTHSFYSTHNLTTGEPFKEFINIPLKQNNYYNLAVCHWSAANSGGTAAAFGQTSATTADCYEAFAAYEASLYYTTPRLIEIRGVPQQYRLGYYPDNTIDLWIDLYDQEDDRMIADTPYNATKWILQRYNGTYNETTGKWENGSFEDYTGTDVTLANKTGKTNELKFLYAEAGLFRIYCENTIGINTVTATYQFELQNPSKFGQESFPFVANINGPLPDIELVIPSPGGTVAYEPSVAISATEEDGTVIESGKQYVLYISHLLAKAEWTISGNTRDVTVDAETGRMVIGPDAVPGELSLTFTAAKNNYQNNPVTDSVTIKLVKSEVETENYFKEAHFDIYDESGNLLTKPEEIPIIEGDFGIGEEGQYNYFTPKFAVYDNNRIQLSDYDFDTLTWSTTSDIISINSNTGRIAVPANVSAEYFPVTLTGHKNIYTMNESGAASNNNDSVLDRNDGFTTIDVSQLYWVQIGEPFTVIDQAGAELTKDGTYTVSSGEQILTITHDNVNTEGYAIAALYEYINGAPKLIEAKSIKATESAAMTLTVPDRKGEYEVKAYQIFTDEYYDDNIPAIYPYAAPRAYPITHK